MSVSVLSEYVSIPQAVSAVATEFLSTTLSVFLLVSIPQAVSAVATGYGITALTHIRCFNTASGKRCCNNLKKSFGSTDSDEFQYRKR